MTLLVSSLFACLLAARFTAAINSVIDIGYARFQGNEPGTGITEFLGVPYAAPPLGDLRWRAPQLPMKSSTIQDATEYKPICAGVGDSVTSTGESEDCLYVNVFTPTNASTTSRLPVMVWIQGGGYVFNSNANYNGTTLAQQGPMVVLTFNYRVGAFGFLANKAVKEDGDLNAGLLDQRMLLQWVQKHISKFGGDPDHVVIVGASAGANSVFQHLAAYGGRDDKLFVGGIAESVWSHAVPPLSSLEFQFRAFVNASGCTSANDTMSCLRGKTTQELRSADVAVPFPGRTTSGLFSYGPVVDGKFIRQPLFEAFRSGKFLSVPLIIGSTTNEGSYFAANAVSASDIVNFFLDNSEGLTAKSAAAIPQIYPKGAPLPQHNAWFSASSAAYGESTFICPANILSRDAAAWSNRTVTTDATGASTTAAPVYHYHYAVLDPANVAAGLGTPHTFEIAAVFGPENEGYPAATYIAPNVNAAIVPVVMDYWVSFVTQLNPNHRRAAGAPKWQMLDIDTPKRLRIQTNNTAMEKWPVAEEERCGFWEGLAKEMQF